jgi:Domain of unknown function (DUF4303)
MGWPLTAYWRIGWADEGARSTYQWQDKRKDSRFPLGDRPNPSKDPDDLGGSAEIFRILIVIQLIESMPDQNQEQSHDGLAPLRMAIVADINRHVASLRQSGVDFYGYAVLPPDYYMAFDPTTLAVAFNCESDVDTANRGSLYYRYSVDEWKNYVHDGFDAVNRELKALLTSTPSADDDSIDDTFVNSVYQAVLDAMLTLRNINTFDDVPYLVVWLSDSGDSILNRSARLLNAPNVYSEFTAEFGD